MDTFQVFKFRLNNKKDPSLKLLLLIERRNQARKHPQELFCKVRAPRNLWELLHVGFNLLDGNEKNIFALRAAAQISECCKIRNNCKAHISSWCKSLNKRNLKPHCTYMPFFKCREVIVQRWSVNLVFLKILQNSQENTCDRVSF